MIRFAPPSLALVVTPAGEAPTPPTGARVELPLGEYEKLRQSQERPSITVVDALHVSGSFRGSDLRLGFTGRATGRMPAEEVLRGGDGLALFGCGGDAIVSRAAQGVQLTPLAARFAASCRVATRGSDRVELMALGSV